MGKAPLLDAAVQNGVDSFYLLRFNVVAVGAGGESCSAKSRCGGMEGRYFVLSLWARIEDLIALTM